MLKNFEKKFFFDLWSRTMCCKAQTTEVNGYWVKYERKRKLETKPRDVVSICKQKNNFMARKILKMQYLFLECLWRSMVKDKKTDWSALVLCEEKNGVAEKYGGGWMGEGGCTSSTICESHFYFLMLMDRQTYLVRQRFFTDYDVCRWHCDMDERREEAEENLQWWRCVLKSTGIKGSPSRTEHTFMSQLKKSGTMSLKKVKVKKVQGYKYLGSTVLSHRDYKKQVNWRSTAVRKSVMSNGWQKVAARVKGNIYKMLRGYFQMVCTCAKEMLRRH